MTERPILFSGPMVRALLVGTKTQTRRAVKPQPSLNSDYAFLGADGIWRFSHPTARGPVSHLADDVRCPYGLPGSRLWVREAFRGCRAYEVQGYPPRDWGNKPLWYEADGDPPGNATAWAERAKPSLHMPRWASRITLDITEVRVERLQSISEADAKAEGAEDCIDPLGDAYVPVHSHRVGYRLLWESINGAGSWAANPWVWAVSFKRSTP